MLPVSRQAMTNQHTGESKASQSMNVLSARPLPSGYTQPLVEVVDLGAYRQLNAAFSILGTNPNGTIRIEHAATKEETAFAPVPGLSADTDNPGLLFATTDAFLRYVRVATGTFGSGADPVASVVIIAKE